MSECSSVRPRAGEIGPIRREIVFEPISLPEDPVELPAPRHPADPVPPVPAEPEPAAPRHPVGRAPAS